MPASAMRRARSRNPGIVAPGIAKDVTSQDFVAYLGSERTMRAVTNDGRTRADFRPLLKAMTSTPLPNYLFRNLGGMRFVNVAKAWGLATPSFSNAFQFRSATLV